MKEIKNFINGEYVASGRTFDKHSPLTGEVIAKVHEASRDQVNAAVAAARAALTGPWSRMTVAERVEKLYALADGINKRFEEFLAAECEDTGKPRSLASHIDIPRGAANFKIFADVVKNVPTEFFEMNTPDGRGAINYGYRTPVGVVGVVCPWNLPLLLMTWKVGPAPAKERLWQAYWPGSWKWPANATTSWSPRSTTLIAGVFCCFATAATIFTSTVRSGIFARP